WSGIRRRWWRRHRWAARDAANRRYALRALGRHALVVLCVIAAAGECDYGDRNQEAQCQQTSAHGSTIQTGAPERGRGQIDSLTELSQSSDVHATVNARVWPALL